VQWKNWKVSNPQRIATNHCLERLAYVESCVSNPQRIATNSVPPFPVLRHLKCFKPSKDRYKRDRISSLRRRRPVSNPQRIATNSFSLLTIHLKLSVSNPQRIATNEG